MKRFLITFCIVFSTLSFFGQTASITIKVLGIEDAKGNMSLALYDKAEDFPGKENYVANDVVPVNTTSFEYVFYSIANGVYAVAIIHDLDKNGELNKNWIGMPKEPFGFSNDAKGRMGPPDFEDASFEVKQDMTIEINLISL